VESVSRKRKIEGRPVASEEKEEAAHDEEEGGEEEDAMTCDGTETDMEVNMGDLEAYARDKIDNFSDSESESDHSGAEEEEEEEGREEQAASRREELCRLDSKRRRKTMFTPEEIRAEAKLKGIIRDHGFYGSSRSPLRAPDRKPSARQLANFRATPSSSSSSVSTAAGSFFGSLSKFLRRPAPAPTPATSAETPQSPATTTTTAAAVSSPSPAATAALLATLAVAPPIPGNLQCHVLHASWQDGTATLTWDPTQHQTSEAVPPPSPCKSPLLAPLLAPLLSSPHRHRSPQKKQKRSHWNSQQQQEQQEGQCVFQVQRCVVRGGSLDLPDFSAVTELGSTPLCTLPMHLTECAPGSAVHLRVRAVNPITRAKSLWSPACSLHTPDVFYLSTVHSLAFPAPLAPPESMHQPSRGQRAEGEGEGEALVEFGENGVLSFLGTAGGTEDYQNPMRRGEVQVEVSCKWYETDLTVYVEQRPSDAQLEMEDYSRFCRPCSFLLIDLGAGRRLEPSAYSLRGFLGRKEVLSSWQLEGSNDKRATEWTLLRRHHNDASSSHFCAEKGYATGSWALPALHKAFRFFRVYQLEPSAPNLTCSGLELYGTLTLRSDDQFRGELVEGVYIPE
jgi:hypothetical protein